MAMFLHIKLARKTKDHAHWQFLIPLELLCCMKTIIHLCLYPEEKEYY